MNISTDKQGNALTIALDGRLDTTTSPELEACLEENLSGVTELTLDLKDLEYISSAGLRVLYQAQKKMNKAGQMVVINVNEIVMEVFGVTGYVDILDIK